MKKTILLAIVLITSFAMYAQIAFEHTYYPGRLQVVKFTTSGHKYVTYDTSSITIYNLNHSVWKTIAIPYHGPYTYNIGLSFLSEELFDTNPATVEYILVVNGIPFSNTKTYIYDEFGNQLFFRDSASASFSFPGIQPVMYTSSGAKLILSTMHGYELYSVPGILACDECSSGTVSGIGTQGGEQPQRLVNPYPNPGNATITLPYSLPANVARGELVIYDMAGKEVKRVTITDQFSSIELDAAELSAGTYYYNILTLAGVFPGRQIVIAN
jgi:hypothetical protein